MYAEFKDKVGIVTGAGGGIGQAYAEALAREGAAVVVADINLEGAQKVADGIKGEGGNALAPTRTQRISQQLERGLPQPAASAGDQHSPMTSA